MHNALLSASKIAARVSLKMPPLSKVVGLVLHQTLQTFKKSMALLFHGSDNPTLGIEVELQIIDPKSLDLTPQSEQILEICQKIGIERIKAEVHQSMIEVDSEIANDVKECCRFLKNRIAHLSTIADSLGLKLGMTGTHPFQLWADRLITNHDRYQNLHEKFQWLARRMNVYGMHVHIGVASGDRAIAICQAMIEYLPYLLALSANSPFWQGIDTGMQSSRVNILDIFPYCGLPLNISRWEEFEHYYDTLHRVGAIKTFKDLYWYVRPNLAYGTVEVRICDVMSSVKENIAIVALVQCLIAKINQRLDAGSKTNCRDEDYWIAPENQWIAARDGLNGMVIVNSQGQRQKISEGILKLIEELSPLSKTLNCYEELNAVKEIITHGNGAQRQRRTFDRTGSLKDVVLAAQQEFYASL